MDKLFFETSELFLLSVSQKIDDIIDHRYLISAFFLVPPSLLLFRTCSPLKVANLLLPLHPFFYLTLRLMGTFCKYFSQSHFIHSFIRLPIGRDSFHRLDSRAVSYPKEAEKNSTRSNFLLYELEHILPHRPHTQDAAPNLRSIPF